MEWQGFVVAVCLAILMGCSPSANGLYKPNPRDSVAQPKPLKVAVVEFEDRVASVGFHHTSPFYALIPGTSESNALVFHSTKFGKCLSSELHESGLFGALEYYPSWDNLDREFKTYDLIISGRLDHDRVELKTASYGFGVLAMPAYMVGAPEHRISREVQFEVYAVRPYQPWQEVWNHPVQFDDAYYLGLGRDYGGDPHEIFRRAVGEEQIATTDFCTTDLLRPQFLALRKSLANSMSKIVAQGELNRP